MGILITFLIIIIFAGLTVRAMYLAQMPGLKEFLDPYVNKFSPHMTYLPPWWVFVGGVILFLIWYNLSNKANIIKTWEEFALKNGFAYDKDGANLNLDNSGTTLYGVVHGKTSLGPFLMYMHYYAGSSGSNGIGKTGKSTSGGHNFKMQIESLHWKKNVYIHKNIFHDSSIMKFVEKNVDTIFQRISGKNLPSMERVKTGDDEFDNYIAISGPDALDVIKSFTEEQKKKWIEIQKIAMVSYQNGVFTLNLADVPNSCEELFELYQSFTNLIASY